VERKQHGTYLTTLARTKALPVGVAERTGAAKVDDGGDRSGEGDRCGGMLADAEATGTVAGIEEEARAAPASAGGGWVTSGRATSSGAAATLG
jgi:hypothetical protein